MRKKRLMELKPLKVMNRHIADAKKTEISLSTLEKQRGEPGKYRMYCRAAVEKGILKVYLFAVTDIEENINFPRYRLFISRKERRFITYDEKLKKWRKALLESILWDARIDFGNIYVNDCDTKVIQKYLKTMQPAIRALEEFQANIRKEQRIRHDKKLTDSWDQVMKTVSGLPKNWIRWVSKYGITEHYIFYKYQKNGATEGYCTYCKKHVPIRSPKYNQKGQCNVCGQPIIFVLWESLEDFVQSGTESILSRGDARLLVLCSGSFMPERGIKGTAIQIAKLPAMKSREESSLQMERKFQILFMACLNSGKCDGFHMGNLGIILAAVFSIKGWSILTPCRICLGMN